MKQQVIILPIIVFVLFLFSFSPLKAEEPVPPELKEYLTKADESFRWEIVEKKEVGKKKSYLLKMVSQTWHEIPWEHYLFVSVPEKLQDTEHCFLFITGGTIGRMPRDGDRMIGEMVSEAAGMSVAMLFQVPNQPLFGNYVEDALIGETLLKALESKDATWPLLFPMAKSAIRAMDAVQELIKQEENREINGFVISGASKRGWTSWLSGASGDKRILAIAPIVIDTLNLAEQMRYQKETWGAFSPSIHDYTERNLVQDFDEEMPEFQQRLWKMIDPYSYRSELTLPKLLVHGTNDPYWTVDASRHYWDDLPGVKYILTLPNVGHNLGDQQLKGAKTIAMFTKHACSGKAWPKMDWTRTEEDAQVTITIETEIPVGKLKLWTAKSETKDFRKARWNSKTLPEEKNASGKYVVTVERPDSGHIAYYVELESESGPDSFSVTTQVWRD